MSAAHRGALALAATGCVLGLAAAPEPSDGFFGYGPAAARQERGLEAAFQALLQVERNWLDPEGLPGRPWFKHTLYAARHTYAHLELPGLTEAAEEEDWPRAVRQAAVLERALARNTALVDSLAQQLSPDDAPAELVLNDAQVYTMDAARSWAQALAVRGGRIVYVGSEAGVARFVGSRTRQLALAGRMVVPGFQDAHVHPVSGGIELTQCNLNDLSTHQAVLAKVAECARDRSRPWLVGGGWLLPLFAGGAPTRQELDAIVPDRPAYLSAADGHSAWVNSKALSLAGVGKATPDPENGRIERDAGGEPLGTLREDAAMNLVGRLLPRPTPAERAEGLRRALAYFARLGITTLQEADASRSALEAYRDAERVGALTARVVAALATETGAEDTDRPHSGSVSDVVARLVELRTQFASPRLHPTAAKIYADGVVEARTAAMLEPYSDRPGTRGEPTLSPERLNALVAALVRERFSVHIHAIGDRAVRISLDALQAAGARAGDGARHQLAHVEFVHPQDVPRFRSLGVIANFQPLWAYADSYVTDLTLNGVSAGAARYIYPIGSIVRAGAPLAFGSDWSVSSANPLEGIQVAVTRQGLDGKPEAFLPGEAIDLASALAAYTIGAARANGLDSETGSLEVGKWADLAVLDGNVFARPASEIAKTRVLLTLLEGQPVYRDPALAW